MNALRAFEAAARLGGFKLAASELNVSPAAISQHIKALEEWSGRPLFERHPNGIVLCEIGKDILPDITGGLDMIGQSVHRLRTISKSHDVAIATLPSVALLWLSQRLPYLRAQLAPDKISVSAHEVPPNLLRELYDVSIFFRTPTGSKNEVILEEDIIYPVCSPNLSTQITTFDDLAQQTLITDSTWESDWSHWWKVVKHPLVSTHGPSFSLYSMALEEAKNDAGVLMGHHSLVRSAIELGQLVTPFNERVKTGKALIAEFANNPRARALQEIFEKLVD